MHQIAVLIGKGLVVLAGLLEKEHDDFLIRVASNIHCAMHIVGGRIPIRITWRNGKPLHGAPVAILDGERIATHDDGKAMAGIGVPGCRLAGFENASSDHQIVSAINDFFLHRFDWRC